MPSRNSKRKFKKGDRVFVISLEVTGTVTRCGRYTATVELDEDLGEKWFPKEKTISTVPGRQISLKKYQTDVDDLEHLTIKSDPEFESGWENN